MRIVPIALLVVFGGCASTSGAANSENSSAASAVEPAVEEDSSPPVEPDPNPIPAGLPQELAERIDLAIALLEQHKYKEFIETTASPSDIAKILEQTSLEELAERFGQEKATKALDALKQARQLSPQPIEDGAAMHFETKPKDMEFELVNGVWYMRN